MSERPMDGTGTLRQRGRDGQPVAAYFGGAQVDGGYWVQMVDAWPHGPLQAQLDRIEALLGGNRWVAFTDAELDGILRHIMFAPSALPIVETLPAEIKAEIERRKA